MQKGGERSVDSKFLPWRKDWKVNDIGFGVSWYFSLEARKRKLISLSCSFAYFSMLCIQFNNKKFS